MQLIMQELRRRGISNHHTLAYQSRVGPVEWLKPYTDASIKWVGGAGRGGAEGTGLCESDGRLWSRGLLGWAGLLGWTAGLVMLMAGLCMCVGCFKIAPKRAGPCIPR